MKIFIITFIIGALVNYSHQQLTPQQLADIRACVQETNVDPELLKGMAQGQITDDPNAKCFLKCALVKTGHMTESGDFVMDNIKNAPLPPGVNQDQFDHMTDTCVQKVGTDPCDIAYNAVKCFIDEIAKVG